MSAPAVRVHSLHAAYGDRVALDGIDIDIAPGEIVGVVGPNGAGKSTLLKAIAGLHPPSRGTIKLSEPGSLGYAPQALGIYPTASVSRNLAFFAELHGLRRSDARERATCVAARLGLDRDFESIASTLSGGRQRLLHVAAALVHAPSVVLLDEPTTGIDPETRATLLSLVHELAGDGAAVCIATHQLDDVESLGASILLLDQGRTLACGPLNEVVAAGGGPAVELTFDGDAPSLHAGVDGFEVERSGPRLVVRTSDPAAALATVVRLAPESIARLRNVEISTPGLAAAFGKLTGHAYPRVEATGANE